MPIPQTEIKTLASQMPTEGYSVGQVKDIAGSYPDLMATSKSSRSVTSQNSAMIDGKIANLSGQQQQQQGGMFTDPNTGIQYNGTGPDGKPLRSATQNTPSLPSGTAADFANSYDVVNNVQNKTKYEAMLANEQKASGGQNGAGTAGAPSAAQGIANDQNALLESQLGTANDTLSKTLASASADEAALIQSIQATYNSRRQKMEDLNNRMLEGKRIAGISAGRQRYATAMEGGLLSNEELNGMQRITELNAEELSLIVQAKNARSKSQIEAFNKYADRLTQINSDKIDVLTKLQSATIEADKLIAQKQKDALTEKQNTLNYQQDLATSYARGAYEQLQTFKTEEEKQAYITKLATEYKIDPEILSGAIQDYQDKEETQNSQIEARESAATAREQSLDIQEQRLALSQEKAAGTSPASGFKLTQSQKSKIIALGSYSEKDITDMEAFAKEYGLNAMLAGVDEKDRAQFQTIFGAPDSETGEKQFLTPQYLSANIDDADLKSIAENLGYRHLLSSWSTEKKNLTASDGPLMKQVATYRKSGLTDKEILELLTK